MGRTVAKTGPAARRKGETDEGYAARVWALRKLGLVDDDNKTTSRTQLAVRREFRWVAAAAAITGAGAWAVTTHGVLGWLAVGACLYGARPARRVWGWTKPRRDAIVPDPRGPRALYEKLVPGARARGTAARLNGRWLSICREAKWTRGTGTDERAPSLIYCRAESDDTIAIAWRPWINDQENTWERQANIVKQAIGAPTVRWWTNDGDSGILEVRIGITPLPPKVVLHSPPPPATPDAGCAIYLGPMAGGGDVYWRPVDSPHLFVTGETGGGKGVAIRLMLAQVVLHCRVLIINTKDSGEFGWLNDHPNVEIVGIEALPDDPTEEQVRAAEQAMRRTAAAAIRRVGSERIRRQGIVKRANVDRWCDLTGPNTFPPYFVFVDETAQLLEDTSDEAAVNAAEELREIARMARSAGISLVLATQRGDVATLGANGGSLRNNLTGGLGVGGLDQDGLGMLTRGRVKADLGVLRKRIKGRAIALGLDSEGGAEVSVVQIAYLSQETAALAAGARLSGHVAEAVSDLAGSDPPTAPRRGAGGGETGSDIPDTESDIVSGRGGAAPAANAAGDGGGYVGLGADTSAPPDDGEDQRSEPGPVDPGPQDTGAASPEHGEQGQVMSLAEAAERLGKSDRTVRRWAAKGDPRVSYVAHGKVRVRA